MSRKIYLAHDLKEAKSSFDRLLGLLRKSNPRSLLFETRFGVHTLFLKEPVDIVVLDNKYKVAKLCSELGPNRFFFYSPKYPYILELSRGIIKKSGTIIGDKLEIKD